MYQKKYKERENQYALSFREIEKEFHHYTDVLHNKVVMLDCTYVDIPNLWTYFTLKFDYLGLRRLLVPVYEESLPSYVLELERDLNADGVVDQDDVTISILHGSDDVDDDEKIRMYNAADVVVICRPFHLMESYIERMEDLGKDWIAIGGNLAILSKSIFNRFKDGRLSLGVNDTSNKKFEDRDGNEKSVSSLWYTSLDVPRYVEPLVLTKAYDPETYPKHDNFDAIECGRVDDIPYDYEGVMAVPPSFFSKWNKEQFDIVGFLSSPKVDGYNYGMPQVNGTCTFGRLLIRRKGL